MKNTGCCPKCNSRNIVRVPDNPNRYASGNNVYTTTITLFGKILVIRYVCCDCGYVEKRRQLNEIKKEIWIRRFHMGIQLDKIISTGMGNSYS